MIYKEYTTNMIYKYDILIWIIGIWSMNWKSKWTEDFLFSGIGMSQKQVLSAVEFGNKILIFSI